MRVISTNSLKINKIIERVRRKHDLWNRISDKEKTRF